MVIHLVMARWDQINRALWALPLCAGASILGMSNIIAHVASPNDAVSALTVPITFNLLAFVLGAISSVFGVILSAISVEGEDAKQFMAISVAVTFLAAAIGFLFLLFGVLAFSGGVLMGIRLQH